MGVFGGKAPPPGLFWGACRPGAFLPGGFFTLFTSFENSQFPLDALGGFLGELPLRGFSAGRFLYPFYVF